MAGSSHTIVGFTPLLAAGALAQTVATPTTPSREQIMSATQTIKSQPGIVVSTPLTAGGIEFNHAEGIVVR